MARRQDDGHTLRQHLERLVRSGRMPAEELEGPPFPESVRHLWEWFGELQMTRRVGAVAIDPVGYLEIDAWARLTGREIRPHEVRGLVHLDAAYRAALNEREE